MSGNMNPPKVVKIHRDDHRNNVKTLRVLGDFQHFFVEQWKSHATHLTESHAQLETSQFNSFFL